MDGSYDLVDLLLLADPSDLELLGSFLITDKLFLALDRDRQEAEGKLRFLPAIQSFAQALWDASRAAHGEDAVFPPESLECELIR